MSRVGSALVVVFLFSKNSNCCVASSSPPLFQALTRHQQHKRLLMTLISTIFYYSYIARLTCKLTSRRCSFTQFLNVFACISTQRSSLPRIFMPLAAVPSGERATRPAWVIFCMSVVPSWLCCSNPAWVIRAPFGKSIIFFRFAFLRFPLLHFFLLLFYFTLGKCIESLTVHDWAGFVIHCWEISLHGEWAFWIWNYYSFSTDSQLHNTKLRERIQNFTRWECQFDELIGSLRKK